MTEATLVVHVTCPLCGEDLGPVRYPGDLLGFLSGSVVGWAWEHCLDRHSEASGIWDFYVETDVDRERTPMAGGGEITALQIAGIEPVRLPAPAVVKRRIERQRLRRAELAERDGRFLRALLQLALPAGAVVIGRRAGIPGQQSRYCAERLLGRELIERLPDGRLQAR